MSKKELFIALIVILAKSSSDRPNASAAASNPWLMVAEQRSDFHAW